MADASNVSTQGLTPAHCKCGTAAVRRCRRLVVCQSLILLDCRLKHHTLSADAVTAWLLCSRDGGEQASSVNSAILLISIRR